jgi:UDP:flavonoid glycosyltransferase YjiC (YdhE family)
MRVALIAGPDAGHAYPIIALGAELLQRGHAVRVGTGPDYQGEVERAGMEFFVLPLLAPQAEDVDIAHRLWTRAGQMAPPLADMLRSWTPDLVVSDTLTAAGGFAAELLGLPWIEVIPHYLPDPDPALPPVGLGRLPSTRPWRRLDDASIRRRQQTSLAIGAAHRDRVRASIGLSGAGRAAARLVCNLPSLEHPRARWPGDVHLVGPLSWEPPLNPLPLPDGTEPLVVVTDSTASTAASFLAEPAVRGLRNAGVRLAVTTSQPVTPWSRACVVGKGPHGPLLDAAAVAVGPGGGGFLMKTMARGVPMVVIPLMGDQRESASRVTAAGAGRRLSPALLSPTTLRASVLRVLHDDRYARAAARLAAEAADLGPRRAAQIVEAIAAGETPVGRGPQR